jgi:hypothetical protein
MTLYRYGRRLIDPRQQYRRWIDPRVRTLRVAAVVEYLRSHGWTEVAPDRPGFRVFQEPAGATAGAGPFYQFVPDSEGYDNYAQSMFELLSGLAEWEDRQATEVIDDIVRLAGQGEPNGAVQAQPSGTEATRK